MAVDYTFLATDLVTNKVLGELPVTGVQLDCQLNNAGNMSAGANLSDIRIDTSEFLSRTQPGRTAFWAYRESTIVWGGIIWTREYQSNGRAISLTGQTFESYAARRFPRSWLGKTVKTFKQGQCSIINELWVQMQNVKYGSIGVLPCKTFPPKDVVRTLTVNGYDLSVSFDDAIQSILQFSNGPDYTITWSEDGNGLPLKTLSLGAPLGNPVSTTTLSVDFPGGVLDYAYTENSSDGANQWYAVGSGTGAATIVGVATDSTGLSAGYPLIESVGNFSSVTVQATADSHASSELRDFPMPHITHAADLIGELFPTLGQYNMGDYAIINIIDSRFPSPGITLDLRVIGWTINPPDTNSGVESVSLVFDQPTVTG